MSGSRLIRFFIKSKQLENRGKTLLWMLLEILSVEQFCVAFYAQTNVYDPTTSLWTGRQLLVAPEDLFLAVALHCSWIWILPSQSTVLEQNRVFLPEPRIFSVFEFWFTLDKHHSVSTNQFKGISEKKWHTFWRLRAGSTSTGSDIWKIKIWGSVLKFFLRFQWFVFLEPKWRLELIPYPFWYVLIQTL